MCCLLLISTGGPSDPLVTSVIRPVTPSGAGAHSYRASPRQLTGAQSAGEGGQAGDRAAADSTRQPGGGAGGSSGMLASACNTVSIASRVIR